MPSKKSSQTAGAPPPDVLGREFSDAVVFFHEALAAQLGMSAAEWKCLGLLDQHGPSTASRLAELSGFTTGAITGIVDRTTGAGEGAAGNRDADLPVFGTRHGGNCRPLQCAGTRRNRQVFPRDDGSAAQ
jgi:hypothetical protein